MVQEAVPAGVVDLTSSEPAGESVYNGVKASATASVAPKTEEEDDEDAWEDNSLLEEILDEVEAFDYSTDGEWRAVLLK